jgi:intraflagellar transport protein 172
MVFVYKIGTEWGDKKSICNKFQHSCPINALVWPTKRSHEIVYGLQEGKVKVGQMKTHKAATLYTGDSAVVAIATNPDGNAVVCAHLDGSIYSFWFENAERGARVIVRHPTPAFALAWGTSVVVGGNDKTVTFYDEDGGEEHSFDYGKSESCRDFTTAVSNPTGDGVVLGNFNAFYIYTRNKDTMGWEEKNVLKIEDMYSVTAMDWKSDGGKIATGNVCGITDLYDVCVKRSVLQGGFELTYVSHSQVIVSKADTNARIVVRSNYGCEILKTNIYQSRYVVAHTTDTLVVGDMETLKMSEIQWHGDGSEKFIFDNPALCIIYFAGEANMVEYGINELLGSVRTAHVNRHVLSVRINERPTKPDEFGNVPTEGENKKVAFLLDAQTVSVKDLSTQSSVMLPHDFKIDWLELNARADLLLFRDKRRHLHIYDLATQTRSQLLNFCTYVQWVPLSDVVVAQNRGNLCVWYNIQAPDQVTLHAIKGDVEDIERVDGRTEVVVDEGISQAIYPLDEALIQFSTSMDDRDFTKAMDILSSLQLSPEAEAMWRQLKSASLVVGDLAIAQRCAAAVGDIAGAKYLGGIADLQMKAVREAGLRPDEHYMVRSKMALLKKDLMLAEDELLNQGKVDECIEMYQSLSKYAQAIRVAEQNRHPDAAEMRQAYFSYLLDTNQEEQAAALKEKEMDFVQAINLYLKGGMPAKAAQVVIDQDIRQPVQLLDTIATALTRAQMYDKAGEFYERLEELQRALDSYVRGNAFRRAVDLARRNFPGRVVELQDQWGDYLVSQQQIDMAINHFIEAKAYQKAIEAALNARQYARALQLVDAIDSESSRPYYKQLARHYEASGQHDLAERCYVAAEQPQAAVEMYTRLGRWEVAHRLATSYMSEGEVGLLYINQAQKLESQGRFREAEKLYITVNERDLAINMYKRNRRFDDMVRLVQEYRPDLLKETHQFLAQTLEMEGSLKEAEQHYVEAQEWHSAVNMYRSNELWDDSFRVAKFYGGIAACKRVTIALLMAMGVPSASKVLLKHGLVEAAIEHAAENGAFEMAFELANHSLPKKLGDIHLKYALFLEDEERFPEAEQEFVKAEKPKEAIDMYVHQQDWEAAVRVAETYEPASVVDVYLAHGKFKADAGQHAEAESLYIQSSRPEFALAMYQEADLWEEALRIAKTHLPHRVGEISQAHSRAQASGGIGGSKNQFLQAGRQKEQARQYDQAVLHYLSAKLATPADSADMWCKAVDCARTHAKNLAAGRYVEVTIEVSRRLIEIQREEAAADMLFEIGRHEDAIMACIQGRKFDKARALAQGHPQLKAQVEEAYQAHLVNQEDTGELMELGRTDVALDVLAKRGDWDRLWEVAVREKTPAAVIGRFSLMRCEELLKHGGVTEIDQAVTLLGRHPGPVSDQALSAYKRLARAVLARSQEDITLSVKKKAEPGEAQAAYEGTVVALRDILFRAAAQFKGMAGGNTPADLQDALMTAHYLTIFFQMRELGIKDLAAKCSITLLKYPQVLPQDKAFYQAGLACKEQGNNNLAFLLLNRYVDISEAIDSQDASALDSTDYHETDAIPLNGPLPRTQFLGEEEDREEVRDWVLSVITDSSVDQQFPPREQSRNTLYEGMFTSDRPTCIVTGYPVQSADLLEVNQSIANRRDWNAYVGKKKKCPWTSQAQNPLY